MANINLPYDLTKIRDSDDFMRFCSDAVTTILTTLNGSLDFTNLKTQQVDIVFTQANANTPIAHNLNKTGVNYIVVSQDAATSIYRGSGDTNKTIILKASVATTATLILY